MICTTPSRILNFWKGHSRVAVQSLDFLKVNVERKLDNYTLIIDGSRNCREFRNSFN